MRSIKKIDEEGVLDIPFKIIIMIVLIGSVVPLGLMSYRNISREKFKNRIKNELEDIYFSAKEVSLLGNLSTQNIEINLKGNLFAGIDYVKIIDSRGNNESLIKYKFDWRKELEHIHLCDSRIKIENEDFMMLHDSKYELSLKQVEYPGGSHIVISKNN